MAPPCHDYEASLELFHRVLKSTRQSQSQSQSQTQMKVYSFASSSSCTCHSSDFCSSSPVCLNAECTPATDWSGSLLTPKPQILVGLLAYQARATAYLSAFVSHWASFSVVLNGMITIDSKLSSTSLSMTPASLSFSALVFYRDLLKSAVNEEGASDQSKEKEKSKNNDISVAASGRVDYILRSTASQHASRLCSNILPKSLPILVSMFTSLTCYNKKVILDIVHLSQSFIPSDSFIDIVLCGLLDMPLHIDALSAHDCYDPLSIFYCLDRCHLESGSGDLHECCVRKLLVLVMKLFLMSLLENHTSSTIFNLWIRALSTYSPYLHALPLRKRFLELFSTQDDMLFTSLCLLSKIQLHLYNAQAAIDTSFQGAGDDCLESFSQKNDTISVADASMTIEKMATIRHTEGAKISKTGDKDVREMDMRTEAEKYITLQNFLSSNSLASHFFRQLGVSALFAMFLRSIDGDVTLLLDMIISDETSCLQFLLHLLKLYPFEKDNMTSVRWMNEYVRVSVAVLVWCV